jgi:hypothetical protein
MPDPIRAGNLPAALGIRGQLAEHAGGPRGQGSKMPLTACAATVSTACNTANVRLTCGFNAATVYA